MSQSNQAPCGLPELTKVTNSEICPSIKSPEANQIKSPEANQIKIYLKLRVKCVSECLKLYRLPTRSVP